MSQAPREEEGPPADVKSFPAITVLLIFLYVGITCDVVYVICFKCFSSGKPRRDSIHRRPAVATYKRTSYVPTTRNDRENMKKNNLTIDHLWKRIKTEMRRMQKVNASHRDITLAMMERRIEARREERERSQRPRSRSSSLNQSSLIGIKDGDDEFHHCDIDIIRWANRITMEHFSTHRK